MAEGKLKVGVIGVGRLGEYHVQKYKALADEVELVGIVDTNRDRVMEISNRYGVKAFGDRQELLDIIDAASLAVPTEAHYEVGKDILSNKVHLLIEKPITYCIDHADDLIKLANDNELILQVGLIERFSPPVVRLQSLLNAPFYIEAHRMNPFTVRGTDVDVVLDLMIHDIDIILRLIKSPLKSIHAVGMSVVTEKIDVASARMVFENGIAANLTASRISDEPIRMLRVFQPDMCLNVDFVNRSLKICPLSPQQSEKNSKPGQVNDIIEYPGSDPLADQIRSFVQAVQRKIPPVVTGEQGREALCVALNIIDQIERRDKDFRPVL